MMIIFRLPFQDTFFSTDNLSEENWVSFFSFSLNKVKNFNGTIINISEEEMQNKGFRFSEKHIIAETKEDYILKIKNTIEKIKEHNLPKLVVARKKIVSYENKINITETLKNLAKNYPSAFVYAFQDEDGVWIGAFSELLGKYHKASQTFETMSLAGTLPISEEWTKKEIEEQKPVTDYILNILKNYNSVQVSETKDHFSGNIKHLRTDFSTLIAENEVENLITELHPTPAVCGIPKDFCKNLIHEMEHFDREFYAGFSKIEMADEVYYFVNLRCGKFYKNTAEIFVGGGITALSDPEKEWRETELKADNLIRNLVWK